MTENHVPTAAKEDAPNVAAYPSVPSASTTHAAHAAYPDFTQATAPALDPFAAPWTSVPLPNVVTPGGLPLMQPTPTSFNSTQGTTAAAAAPTTGMMYMQPFPYQHIVYYGNAQPLHMVPAHYSPVPHQNMSMGPPQMAAAAVAPVENLFGTTPGAVPAVPPPA
ncbi:hypothetical protein HK104_003601, partial [Borealophlyctis nickersoniae]